MWAGVTVGFAALFLAPPLVIPAAITYIAGMTVCNGGAIIESKAVEKQKLLVKSAAEHVQVLRQPGNNLSAVSLITPSGMAVAASSPSLEEVKKSQRSPDQIRQSSREILQQNNTLTSNLLKVAGSRMTDYYVMYALNHYQENPTLGIGFLSDDHNIHMAAMKIDETVKNVFKEVCQCGDGFYATDMHKKFAFAHSEFLAKLDLPPQPLYCKRPHSPDIEKNARELYDLCMSMFPYGTRAMHQARDDMANRLKNFKHDKSQFLDTNGNLIIPERVSAMACWRTQYVFNQVLQSGLPNKAEKLEWALSTL
jgi:hypothetical protein